MFSSRRAPLAAAAEIDDDDDDEEEEDDEAGTEEVASLSTIQSLLPELGSSGVIERWTIGATCLSVVSAKRNVTDL